MLMSFLKFAKTTALKRILLPILCMLLFFAACTTNGVVEMHTTFPQHSWSSTEKPSYQVNIEDTAASYKVYIVLRHSDAYRYKNLWMDVAVKQPDGKTYHQKINFLLASDENGWLGSGMDDIWEHRILLNATPLKFPHKGSYTFQLQQLMREDPLEYVMNTGLRVEKLTP